ncbi:glycosyltransferase family 4 protein [Candidatus Dependentiae bacterium]|nr:glycosyltransferase family 4 protein [Candidatus Dependentiae bacterium]
MSKKILFLTKYNRLGANSRYRSYQYIPYLKKEGIIIDTTPLFDEIYVKNIYSTKKHFLQDILRCYFKRLIILFSVKKYDLLLIEAELFPYIPGLFEWLLKVFHIPYLLDYDDAIFHHYDTSPMRKIILGSKIKNIAKKANAIVTGSPYLTAYMEKYNNNVFEIPTVIDLKKYPEKKSPLPEKFTIGWIGSPYTEDYMMEIYPVLKQFGKNHDYKLVLIGANESMRKRLKGINTEIWKWTEEDEVKDIREFNVGIMPLPDTKWTRGKCGLKLIQYMGCFLPVIATPVGINNEIIENKINGYLADTQTEWLDALNELYENKDLQIKMGTEGRKLVEEKYEIGNGASLLSVINKFL